MSITKPGPPPAKPAVVKKELYKKALIILEASRYSNDAESEAIINLIKLAPDSGNPTMIGIANYLAEAIIYGRVNITELVNARNSRR